MADSAGKQPKPPEKPQGVAPPEKPQEVSESVAVEPLAPLAEEPARFSHKQLLEHSRRLTGVSRHVLFGALSTHDGSHLSAEEARELVEQFCQKEVAPR
jgi:hypothetical protein